MADEMAPEEPTCKRLLLVPRTPVARNRRRHLPMPIRYIIVAVLGVAVALLAFYLLRTIGY